MPRGVEQPVDLELEGVGGLDGPDAGDEAGGGAGDGAGEVADAGVEGEVLAPGAALAEGLLGEEELRGGGELVEALDRGLEVLVGVVQAVLLAVLRRFLVAIGAPEGHRLGRR